MSEQTGERPATTEMVLAAKVAREALQGGGDLVPLAGAPAEVVRESYANRATVSVRAVKQAMSAVQARKEEIRRLKDQLDAQLRAEIAEMEKTLGPLREQVARLQEGQWTISLYLGRDEQIEQLAHGEPASADEPITLRQLVLAMDEECLVAADGDGVDARRVDDFAAWLLSEPHHLEQVLPDRRGVVVLVPTRQRRDYGDPWTAKAMAKANAVSYWVIRNGANVYLMTTDIEVGDRLLPTRAEFSEFFYREPTWRERDEGVRGRIALEPGSEQWLTAERAAEGRQRHYMRIMMILQGLADRTAVFHPLRPGGVNFLSVASQDEGRVRIINELDNVLTSGREPFREWQAALNAKLRPGMRIIGAFHGKGFADANHHDKDRYYRHSRLWPETAAKPSSTVVHRIEERVAGGGLRFRYARNEELWSATEGYHEPRNRASCTVEITDDFILPFDLVTEAELHAYLHARTERHAYLSMVPVIKSAIAAKRIEAEAEAPFRLMIAGRIAAAHDVDLAEVEREMSDLVTWWKLTNRHHRPLAGDPTIEAKAIGAIEREWLARRRADGGSAPRDQAAVERIRHDLAAVLGDDRLPPICVARRRDGTYVAYAPEPGAPDERVWLAEHHYGKTLRGRPTTRQWTTIPGKTLASLTVLWSTPEWQQWDHAASRQERLTGPEFADAIEAMKQRIQPDGAPIAVIYAPGSDNGYISGDYEHGFAVYAWANTPRDNTEWARGGRRVGDDMIKISAVWRRVHGEVKLDFHRPEHQPTWERYSYTKAPWAASGDPYYKVRPRLVWSDEEQLARANAVRAAIGEQERVDRERNDRRWAACRILQAGIEAVELQRLKDRFLEDYPGGEDLWADHPKQVDRRVPDNVNALLGRLAHADIDMTVMTLAEAVAADPEGQNIDIPADLASLPLGEPAKQPQAGEVK